MNKDFSHLKGSEPIVGEIFALRTFSANLLLENPLGHLTGLVYPFSAFENDNTAICGSTTVLADNNKFHPAPEENCTCGFYGYDNPSATLSEGFDTSLCSFVGPLVYVDAVVAFSGKVLLCERGLRAEKMRLVALLLREDKYGITPNLQKAYPNIPIYSRRKDMLKDHPVEKLTRPMSKINEDKLKRLRIVTPLLILLSVVLYLVGLVAEHYDWTFIEYVFCFSAGYLFGSSIVNFIVKSRGLKRADY